MRVAFRFGVLYLALFTLATQFSGSLLPNPFFYFRGLGRLSPMRDVTTWVATHLFGVSLPPEEATSLGEPLFFWVQTFWLLTVAAVGTAIWSMLDHRRHYAELHRWARLAVRFVLAAQMFEYGMTKVIPTQFPAPSLETLVTPVGDLTLSALLWTTIGSSPAYEIFTGCVEVLGGLLLLAPRTTLLGALVSLAAAVQIFALNMTFDIGLKLVSFHLIVLAAVLIAPDARRLAGLFVFNRPVAPAGDRLPAPVARAGRRALAAQLLVGAWLLGMYTFINVRFWETGGGGAPRSALYGIWDVERITVDGEEQQAAEADYDQRWRRVIFDGPSRVAVQRTDDSFARYGATLDTEPGVLELTRGNSRTWRARFTVARTSPERLRLTGEMDGDRIQADLRRVDFDTLRLLNSPFRWVRPHASPGP